MNVLTSDQTMKNVNYALYALLRCFGHLNHLFRLIYLMSRLGTHFNKAKSVFL